MKLQLEVAETLRTVDVQRHAQSPSLFRVTIDGRSRLVEGVRVGANTWSLIFHEDAGRRPSIEVVVSPAQEQQRDGNGSVDVHIDGYRVPVHVKGGLGRRSNDRGGAKGSGPQRVTAPMPGKIVRVLVQPGDEVETRQGLVVVEAMKMENELRSAREGRVREVLVAEGQSVEAGSLLVIVE